MPSYGQKTYFKNYHDSGKLKSEGWLNGDQKVDYWFYYYTNGNKKEEGHYEANKKSKWWILYSSNGDIQKKVEFKNNLEEGLSIFYKDGKIIKAARYKAGVLTKEWTTLSSFKRDNRL